MAYIIYTCNYYLVHIAETDQQLISLKRLVVLEMDFSRKRLEQGLVNWDLEVLLTGWLVNNIIKTNDGCTALTWNGQTFGGRHEAFPD